MHEAKEIFRKFTKYTPEAFGEQNMDFWTFIYDYGYFLAIGVFLISLIIQFWLRATFRRFNKVMTKSGISGKEAAEIILRKYNLNSPLSEAGYTVDVESVSGSLTDHYSPKEKKIRLSEATYGSHSIAAIGVAAHECGHAIQDAKSFIPNKIRTALVPIAGIGSRFGPYISILGLLIWNRSQIGEVLFMTGILFFSAAALFYAVTLPVEIDASRRAINVLKDERILTQEEISGARKVLTAAAMTYVAAVASSILQLLRLIAMRNRRK